MVALDIDAELRHLFLSALDSLEKLPKLQSEKIVTSPTDLSVRFLFQQAMSCFMFHLSFSFQKTVLDLWNGFDAVYEIFCISLLAHFLVLTNQRS